MTTMNHNIVSTCMFLAASAVFCPFVLPAMPTRAELKEAQPIVSELMAADVAALKAGKTDAKAVAEKALGYVEEASTDAAKYLLLQGAFYNFTNAKEYDKAADTVDKLRKTIPDVEASALVTMISKALRKGRAAGRLSEMLEELEREIRFARLVADVDAELKSKPKDAKLLQMSAEYHALTGDWKDALPKFEKIGGKFADVVAFEKGGTSKLTAAEVGDFWWTYPVAGGSEETLNGFKRHAARFYQQALQDSNFKGLKRAIVEKRLAALDGNVAAGGAAAAVDTTSAGKKTNADAVSLVKSERPENLTFKLDAQTDLVMVGCPAGRSDDFLDCHTRKNWQYWQVPFRISRPFWYAEVPTTFGQWLAFCPKTMVPPLYFKVVGNDGMFGATSQEVRQYCDWLNEKFKRRLPKGYVFRLPTMAECEYASHAGVGDRYFFPSALAAARELRSQDAFGPVIRRLAENKGLSLTEKQLKEIAQSCRPVRMTSANDWGIYDAIQPTYVLDVAIEGVNATRLGNSTALQLDGLAPREEPVDPLIYPPLDQIMKNKVMKKVSVVKFAFSVNKYVEGWRPPFRLVLGPDLLKERKLAK